MFKEAAYALKRKSDGSWVGRTAKRSSKPRLFFGKGSLKAHLQYYQPEELAGFEIHVFDLTPTSSFSAEQIEQVMPTRKR